MACFSVRTVAQQSGQKTLSSPGDAISALVTAAQRNDERAMLNILGPDGKQIVSSGDETEDANSRARFVTRYQKMHRLVNEPDGVPSCISARRIGPLPFRSRIIIAPGISKPRRARKKYCTGVLAGMKFRPLRFARGYTKSADGAPTPYRGYYYLIL